MPFEVRVEEGVWFLTLDTPGSPINVFNTATARQLRATLAEVERGAARAVVFQSAKPNSFINGVGLLLAHASQTERDIESASAEPWAAYRAVRELAVPTIALIEGNCFGCGVEFVLHCDYRVAIDTRETQFYMTELNDYLFIPLFGGTWNLPSTVGFSDAVDLLLWGRRWDARTAYQRGLVDEVLTPSASQHDVRAVLERVIDGRQGSRRRGTVAWGEDEATSAGVARQLIEALPPVYHDVYADALNLLERGAQCEGTILDHQRRELASSAASALAPIGKAAYSFFYLRQVASQRAVGKSSAAPVKLDPFALSGTSASGVAEHITARPCGGIVVTAGADAEFRLIPAGGEACPRSSSGDVAATTDVLVETSLTAAACHPLTLYAPLFTAGGRLVELAEDPASVLPDPSHAARLTRGLHRLGFEVARTRPSRWFVSSALLAAYLTPLLELLAAGWSASTIRGDLRALGFVTLPGALVENLGRARIAELLAAVGGRPAADLVPYLNSLSEASYGTGSTESAVVDAMCVSLLAAVLEMRGRGDVRDVVVVDLIARELLDFPRHLGSLCLWLKRRRVAEALTRLGGGAAGVSRDACRVAGEFVDSGQEFYR